jgi:CDP-diacylglycerol---serine O-phosphatidyltransferase
MARKFELKHKKIPFRRGASILPSLFTLGNMFLGYYAIILAYKGNFENAVDMVLLAGILDMMDGRIARMTGTTSEFGKELDSLADFLSFGIAPALILYFWGFSELGRFGWLFVFLLPFAGAIRLARFNIQAQVMDKRFFVGLPIPAAAAASLFPLYYLDADFLKMIRDSSHTLLISVKTTALLYVVLVAFFMVSRIKYRSFKELDVRQRMPYPFFFFVALFVVAIVLRYQLVLLIIALVYLLSGPISYLIDKLQKSPHPQTPPAEEKSDGHS